jgi:hypothetical protein
MCEALPPYHNDVLRQAEYTFISLPFLFQTYSTFREYEIANSIVSSWNFMGFLSHSRQLPRQYLELTCCYSM